VKNKRVENVLVKFHSILSIFQFMVELAMHVEMKVVFVKEKNGTFAFSLNSLDMTF